MKILIIEDEIPAAEQLVTAIKSYDPNIVVMNILDSNEAVFHWFEDREELPELIFSDIELLDGVVFNSLLKLKVNIPIIFTTAYQQFTMNAFDTSGIAYLLKPIEPAAIHKAILKFKQLTQTNSDSLKTLLAHLDLPRTKSYKTRFSVKVGKGIYLLQTSDIACMLMKNGVLHAYKQTGKAFIISSNLNDAYKQLNPAEFFLLNRSDLVNIHSIEKVETYFNDRLAVFVIGQQEALISSAAKTSDFRKWLDGSN